MVVAFVAALVFTLLARSLRRQQLTYVFTAFFLAAFVAYGFLVSAPSGATVWSFYLFGDLYNTLMVATFFAFLNDSVLPEQSKRLYGPIVFGGVVGGVVGSSVVARWITTIPTSTWMTVCFALGVATIVAAWVAGATVGGAAGKAAAKKDIEERSAERLVARGSPARLVFSSRYLLSIVAVVAIYEFASTLLDFMFTSTTTHYLSGEDVAAHFARVFSITNWASMLIQLLLTSFVMRRFGVANALSVQPGAMTLASVAFLLHPGLWVGSALSWADNALAYSLNQSAKESLYTPTTSDEKYAAKAFIDMFVQRFAKALAVGIGLVVTMLVTDFGAVRWLAIAVVLLGVAWLRIARYAGSEFEARSDAARAASAK
jgi:AAA family ATP:ADP antiporter